MFHVNGVPLEAVRTFRYLGRELSHDNSDWLAVTTNVKKARAKWGQISRVLCRQGASPRVSALFYKAICQSVLLFGAETWVLTESMFRLLEGFHHRVVRQITGDRTRYCRRTGEWTSTDIAVVMEKAGMFPIREYISRRRSTIADYVATRPIYQATAIAAQRAGSSSRRLFWGDQLLAE